MNATNGTTLRIAKTVGLDQYTPEMGESRPADAVIDARHAHRGTHYFLMTPLTLSGRGVKHTGTDKDGCKTYMVTGRAFEAICEVHKVACRALLD